MTKKVAISPNPHKVSERIDIDGNVISSSEKKPKEEVTEAVKEKKE